jgi:serine O-acetyltransferase
MESPFRDTYGLQNRRPMMDSRIPTQSFMTYDKNTVKAWAGDSQWRALRADYARFRLQGYPAWTTEGFWAVLIYRLQRMLKTTQPQWLWLPVRALVAILRRTFSMVTRTYISADAAIGPGLLVPHAASIRVQPHTRLGADCTILHGCTIGSGPLEGSATIGDHVFLSCHSTILGPITIGDGATVAANTLVISNVPARATAIGVPAKIIPGISKVGSNPGGDMAKSTPA